MEGIRYQGRLQIIRLHTRQRGDEEHGWDIGTMVGNTEASGLIEMFDHGGSLH